MIWTSLNLWEVELPPFLITKIKVLTIHSELIQDTENYCDFSCMNL